MSKRLYIFSPFALLLLIVFCIQSYKALNSGLMSVLLCIKELLQYLEMLITETFKSYNKFNLFVYQFILTTFILLIAFIYNSVYI